MKESRDRKVAQKWIDRVYYFILGVAVTLIATQVLYDVPFPPAKN